LPLSYVKTSYESDKGVKLEETFEWVEEKALGAASLAQVHKAKLRATGEIVALKL
jgi:predicted unusual protein kinase regulating ubiquinone biosynthesis (AarF/ABC1/UbiB family)